jgi:NADH-quinone oxidoreductase subunit G
MVKEGGAWREVDWETALEAAASGLQKVVREHGAGQLGVLVSPAATTEESYLAARIARGLGSENVDHRLRRQDFRDASGDPVAPTLGCSIAELERASAVLLVGSDVRKEVPIIAHRIRQGAVRHGSKVASINTRAVNVLFPLVANLASNGYGMAQHVAAVLAAALRSSGQTAPASVAGALEGIAPTAEHERIAASLAQGELRVILLGALAERHASFAELRTLAAALAAVTGAKLGYLPEGANAVGASLAGATPHRGAGGRAAAKPGLPAVEMLNARLRGYVLVGGVESADVAQPGAAESALRGAECVVALTPYASEEQKANATVILPVAAFAETSGTWVNVEGRWQSVPGAARPPGEARPAWKVLRVLGNLLGLTGFEYLSSEEVRAELQREVGEFAAGQVSSTFNVGRLAALDATREVGLYAVDAVVRRSRPLQETRDAQGGAA